MKKYHKKISILGSTGSIGRSTIDIVQWYAGRFSVEALAAGSNVDLLCEQTKRLNPKLISVKDSDGAKSLERKLGRSWRGEIAFGEEGLRCVATYKGVDLVVSAIVGAAGLLPTLAALQGGKDVALANKETLVMAGKLIMEEAGRRDVRILPVDSEHSAIYQSIQGHRREDIRRIILTASGGPFLDRPLEELNTVSPEEALNHPKWSMGKKITIDSASLMNKGLEIIEARWLFDIPPDRIDVHIHPQSIVHSMVEYKDGSIIAQMGMPDMRVPISYALSYPTRLKLDLPRLNLFEIEHLTFLRPNPERFPALLLAYEALEKGETIPAVLNAANELAVQAFLDRKIGFTDIPKVVRETMVEFPLRALKSIEDVLQADRWTREKARHLIFNQ